MANDVIYFTANDVRNICFTRNEKSPNCVVLESWHSFIHIIYTIVHAFIIIACGEVMPPHS